MKYEIKMHSSDYREWTMIFSTDDLPFTKNIETFKYSMSLSGDGSCEFTLPYYHPIYSEIIPYWSMIAIFRDGSIVWYGRVSNIYRDFNLNKRITCEIIFQALGDKLLFPFHYWKKVPSTIVSELPSNPTTNVVYIQNGVGQEWVVVDGQGVWQESEAKIKNGNAYKKKKVSKYTYLEDLLEYYNSRYVNKSGYRINSISLLSNIASVVETFSKETIDGQEDFSTVREVLKNQIEENYNLMYVPQFSENTDENSPLVSTKYYMMDSGFGEDLSRTIELGKNLLDLTDEVTLEDVYSYILPVGKDGLLYYNDNGDQDPPQDPDVTTNPMLYKSGMFVQGSPSSSTHEYTFGTPGIDKLVQNDEIDNREDLWSAASLNFNMGGGTIIPELTISAIDMGYINKELNGSMKLGYSYRLKYKVRNVNIDALYILSSFTIDVLSPDKSTYTFVKKYLNQERLYTDKVQKNIIDVRESLNKKLNLNKRYGNTIIDEQGYGLIMNGQSQ